MTKKLRSKSKLTTKQLKFLESYLATGNGSAAARAAGYSPANAAQTACILLKSPAIKEEIERAREGLQKKVGFTLEQAFAYGEEDRNFAREKSNAMAATKSTEYLAKLSGHLIDRSDIRVKQEISIRANIDLANARLEKYIKDAIESHPELLAIDLKKNDEE